jgi:hypothetical protein
VNGDFDTHPARRIGGVVNDTERLIAQYRDPNRPPPCEECGRRPVPSRLAPGQWIDTHGGSCSLNDALQVCERCGHRHIDRDFGQVLACIMDVPLEEGRAMQQRIVRRLEG